MEAKAYALVFNDAFSSDRQAVLDYIDRIPEITYWYTALPHAIFLSSIVAAQELHERIATSEMAMREGARFAFLKVEGTLSQGFLTHEAWRVLNHPESPRMPAS